MKNKYESEYISITHGKLDRKDENYVKQTCYGKDDLFNWIVENLKRTNRKLEAWNQNQIWKET